MLYKIHRGLSKFICIITGGRRNYGMVNTMEKALEVNRNNWIKKENNMTHAYNIAILVVG